MPLNACFPSPWGTGGVISPPVLEWILQSSDLSLGLLVSVLNGHGDGGYALT